MGMPADHSIAGGAVWQDVEGKKAQLNSFITELRASSNRC